ncbi:par-3 family cell polarity regulator beta a isoform X1 [Astyanax mexicanus]|uniref:par-3 family cell polarity regulator beta a isoform X1 n=2 Tax=Astyanax mexicanus TaxID=7994 RepID=UPI0020CB5E3B|nr:par-3 family cell polarity regulator beta a isoform X1 [Astyanax mexicanus]
MKVTVSFGRTGVVVPCKDGWMVRDLIEQATQRYRKIVEQDGEFLVRTHHVEYADGGILDPDDMLTDLVEDKDKLVAVYEEMELQQRAVASPGGSVASGFSSPEPSEPELGLLMPGSEIEVTASALKSNTPLLVRSSSESVLTPPLEAGTREADNQSSRPQTTGTGHALTVRGGAMDRLKEEVPTIRPGMMSMSSTLTKTVEISGDLGPLGIKVVPYCSSLSGRTLGLHVKGIEDNSRSKREGIFQEDECIVQINDTELIDKSFAQSQEVFRQAMSCSLVRLEVLPVANKLYYEKSLIGQLFNGPDPGNPSVPKVKSPFGLRKTDAKVIDRLVRPSSETPPPEETPPPHRHTPVESERRQETPPPPVRASPTPKSRQETPPPSVRASPTPKGRQETPPPPVRASPTPMGCSESPASRRSPALAAPPTVANKKGGKKMKVNLTKGTEGLGFTVVTRDSSVHGPGPILVKSILPRGAAVKDGRLQSGDRILEVNGVDITGHSQEELVAMLRSTKLGETVSLFVTRQEELFLPRELKGEPSAPPPSEDGREQLMFEVPLSDSGSAGLGLSLKGNKSRETGEDLGIFIKSVIHGGAAFKDGRLRPNDQLLAVNGESLLGRSNHDAMETLRRSMSMEGNLRGTIQLVVLRSPEPPPAQESSQTQSRGSPPVQSSKNSQSNGVSQPPMVMNSIYDRAPGPLASSNGRYRVQEEDNGEEDFPPPPADLDRMEKDINLQQNYPQHRVEREPAGRPTYLQHPQTQRPPEHSPTKASRSMDLVADESKPGAMEPQKAVSSASRGQPVGPTLGLQKSSSLESLQTAMEEVSKSETPFHRPAMQMVRGRGCNMSFRQAIDKSYDGPSEPDDDYSDDSSGRDTPASNSSRQELEDGAKEKKKKTKKKKEKKSKAKKKDDVPEEQDKKTKKKGFGLLRFGRKNKDDKAKSKAKLGALSEEEVDKSEAEMLPHLPEVDGSVPGTAFLPDVEDDDFDPNYARINNFREPPPSSQSPFMTRTPSPHHAPPTVPAYSGPPPSEVPLEGLYAKVNKQKPAATPTVAESNEARLQQIRSQLQHLKPVPSYSESGAAHRVQEYDPSRIRGPDSRAAPRYEDIDRQYATINRRNPADNYPTQNWATQKDEARYPNPAPSYNANQARDPYTNRPASPRLPGHYPMPPPPQRGPLRQDVPPSPTLGMRAAPLYETVARGGYRTPGQEQYGSYGDGQYPDPRQKNSVIGAV